MPSSDCWIADLLLPGVGHEAPTEPGVVQAFRACEDTSYWLARSDRLERGDQIALAQRLFEQSQRAPDSIGRHVLTMKAPEAGRIVDVLGSSRQHFGDDEVAEIDDWHGRAADIGDERAVEKLILESEPASTTSSGMAVAMWTNGITRVRRTKSGSSTLSAKPPAFMSRAK